MRASGFRVWGSRFGVWGSGFRDWGSAIPGAVGLGFGSSGASSQIQGSAFPDDPGIKEASTQGTLPNLCMPRSRLQQDGRRDTRGGFFELRVTW